MFRTAVAATAWWRSVCILMVLLGSGGLRAEALGVCIADTEYPPFRYSRVDAEGRPYTDGFHPALLDRLLAGGSWTYQVLQMPARRCLQELLRGDRVQLFIGGYSDSRARDFLLSAPLDRIHFHYFYSRSRFPDGLELPGRAALAGYRLCGIKGHNFEMFGLHASELPTDLADSFAGAFNMLRLQRCDLLPYNIEVIRGYRLVGEDFLADPDIRHQPLADQPAGHHAVMISRRYPQAAALRAHIDASLAALRASGDYAGLCRRYGLDCARSGE